jgi:hypothetical protein
VAGRPVIATYWLWPQSAVDKIPPGSKLDALTAEKVFGWKNGHKHEGSLVGKKQDKAGRIRDRRTHEVARKVGTISEELFKMTRAKITPSNTGTSNALKASHVFS